MERNDYSELFEALTKNLELFIQEIRKKKSNLLATDKWTVKDVLCHVVFWHENYASNYNALAANMEPPLLEGPGYRLNEKGVMSLRKYSTDDLIRNLQKAQQTLHRCIVEKKVTQMTYKKNGHVYKTEDFLAAITRHIATHTKHVKQAK